MGETSEKISAKLIKTGYYSGLVAFFICLSLSLIVISSFLFSTYFWIDTFSGASEIKHGIEILNARLVMARIALLSCGLLAGLSFGFLGFSLFLIGIDGSSDINTEVPNYKVTLSRVSPGILLLLAAVVLVGVCATRKTPFWYEQITEHSDFQPTPTPEPPNKIPLEKPAN
jgi:hypothetical protein